MSDKSLSSDDLLESIDDGDTHDQLLGYMAEDETAEQTLARLLAALPSFASLECAECGRDLDPLRDHDWIAWRLKVEDTERRRTDLYCDPFCFSEALGGSFEAHITEDPR